jgi:hypothetical protein
MPRLKSREDVPLAKVRAKRDTEQRPKMKMVSPFSQQTLSLAIKQTKEGEFGPGVRPRHSHT